MGLLRGHSQVTSVERRREGVGQFLAKVREVAWLWYSQGGGGPNPKKLADVI